MMGSEINYQKGLESPTTCAKKCTSYDKSVHKLLTRCVFTPCSKRAGTGLGISC